MKPEASPKDYSQRLSVFLEDAETFLNALSGAPDDTHCFQLFDDSGAGRRELTAIIYGRLSEVAPKLIELNRNGSGIFVTINRTDGRGRRAENITQARALFVDKDDGALPLTLTPPPSIRVQTKRGEHAYWLLGAGEDLSQFSFAQTILIENLHTDHSIKDKSRVMRVPGFLHMKDPANPFLVGIRAISETRYSISEILAAYPRSPMAFDADPSIVWSDVEKNGALEGTRHVTAQRYVGHLFATGMSWEEARNTALNWNRRANKPPLPDREIEKMVQYVAQKEAQHEEAVTDSSWDTPKPLPDLLPIVPPLPAELLPSGLRDWVVDIAARRQIPLEMPAAAAITAIGAAIGRRHIVLPMVNDDWIVVPNFWGLLIAPPAAMKSPVMNSVVAPLRKLELEAAKRFAEEENNFEVEAMDIDARQKGIQEKLKNMKMTGEEREKLKVELLELRSVRASKHPKRTRYVIYDTSVEKLGEILNANPMGVMILADEISGFLFGMDRDGHETDRAFYLSAWNGDTPYVWDRISRGTVSVEAVAVSLFGGTQPSVLRKYFAENIAGGESGDGFLARFQIAVYPEIPKGYKHRDQSPDARALEKAELIFRRILSSGPPSGGQVAHRFSASAQVVFNAWREELELQLRSGDIPSEAYSSHLTKYRKLLPALALCFHLCENFASKEQCGLEISEETVRRAADFCRYLQLHAEKIYAASIRPDLLSASELLKRIRKGAVRNGCTTRDIYRHNWHLLGPKMLDPALAVLEENGWLKTFEISRGRGRPSEKIILHPSLRSGEQK